MAAILHPHLVHPIVSFECNSSSCSSRADMCSPPGASSLSSCGPSPLRLTLEDSDSDDEVLSVGSETPPLTSPQNNDPPRSGLKFSIDNILKPEFGRPSEDLACDNTDIVVRQKTVKSSNNKKTQSPTSQPINLSAKDGTSSASSTDGVSSQPLLWPAWVYCTRYSDRPSSGRSPRSRKIKRKERPPEEKRPRTAFTSEQLARLKQEFQENRYLTERRRQQLASELKLNESQIKIWFQNKRAKIKKSTGQKNPLALQLMAQGLYNHSTIHSSADSGDDEDSTKD